PRSLVSRAAVAAQHALVMRLYAGLEATWADFKPVAALRGAVAKIAPDDTVSEIGKAAKTLVTTLDSIAGDSLKDAREVWDARPAAWSFVDLNSEFGLELSAQDNADHAPTQAMPAVARSPFGASWGQRFWRSRKEASSLTRWISLNTPSARGRCLLCSRLRFSSWAQRYTAWPGASSDPHCNATSLSASRCSPSRRY